MGAPQNSYWSIEACGWVRFTAPEVDVPTPRPAEDAAEAADAAEAEEARDGAAESTPRTSV